MAKRYKVGETAHIWLKCVNGSGNPAEPDDVPVAKVFDSSGNWVETLKMPIEDRLGVTGLFHLPLYLSGAYSAGSYSVMLIYQNSSFNGIESDTFQVDGSGNSDGQVLNMYFFRRPHADIVVYQGERGSIFKGRNPRI